MEERKRESCAERRRFVCGPADSAQGSLECGSLIGGGLCTELSQHSALSYEVIDSSNYD